MNNTFIMMVGLSGSGKSTIASNYKQAGYKVVASDDIRTEVLGNRQDTDHNDIVFRIAHNRIRDYLLDGYNVVFDATNITMKNRRCALKAIADIPNVHKKCIVTAQTINHCLKKNRNREYPVPDEVIMRQAMRFQVPFLEEGFDEIELSRVNNDNTPLNVISDLFVKFDMPHDNPNHKQGVGSHCWDTMYYILEKKGGSVLVGAALTHDYGKYFTKKLDEENVALFKGHENIGAYKLLSREYSIPVAYSPTNFLDMVFYVNYHMLPYTWKTPNAREKWRKIFGDEKYNNLMLLHKADMHSK